MFYYTINAITPLQIIHHIWLGSELPSRCIKLRQSWLLHHPIDQGWKHLLWTDQHITYALNKQKKMKKVPPSPPISSGASDDVTIEIEENIEKFSIEQINFKLKNTNPYINGSNYGEKSDVLRYEILQQFGGIYVDCDFECLKSFDSLLSCNFFSGFSNTPAAVEVCLFVWNGFNDVIFNTIVVVHSSY